MEKKNKIIICPNCGNECFYLYDEWGRTPWHLHCDTCKINIGGDNFQFCETLLKDYHQPNTYLEYYNKKIHFLQIDKKVIVPWED